MLTLSHVVAISKNNVIGNQNKIPWDLPEDRKHFRAITLNHCILIGKNTYQSIGKALPKRHNVVISRTLQSLPDAQVFASIEKAISYCQKTYSEEQELFIIGGAEIYKETMPMISKIYLTRIDQDYQGDTFYLAIPPEFIETSRDDREGYSFITLERNR